MAQWSQLSVLELNPSQLFYIKNEMNLVVRIAQAPNKDQRHK